MFGCVTNSCIALWRCVYRLLVISELVGSILAELWYFSSCSGNGCSASNVGLRNIEQVFMNLFAVICYEILKSLWDIKVKFEKCTDVEIVLWESKHAVYVISTAPLKPMSLIGYIEFFTKHAWTSISPSSEDPAHSWKYLTKKPSAHTKPIHSTLANFVFSKRGYLTCWQFQYVAFWWVGKKMRRWKSSLYFLIMIFGDIQLLKDNVKIWKQKAFTDTGIGLLGKLWYPTHRFTTTAGTILEKLILGRVRRRYLK